MSVLLPSGRPCPGTVGAVAGVFSSYGDGLPSPVRRSDVAVGMLGSGPPGLVVVVSEMPVTGVDGVSAPPARELFAGGHALLVPVSEAAVWRAVSACLSASSFLVLGACAGWAA